MTIRQKEDSKTIGMKNLKNTTKSDYRTFVREVLVNVLR